MYLKTTHYLLSSLCLLAALNGCATSSKDQRDPFEGWNRNVQTFNDKLDQYALKPVAEGYRFVMPSFADNAVTNFFNNIDDIGVVINDLLQLKFQQSGQDSARFLLNTTAGLAGFIDVAKDIDLPKHVEDFDQTLGFWGIPSGPYVVLPLFGPSTPRGIGGRIGDAAMNPITYIGLEIIDGIGSTTSNAVGSGLTALKYIDTRADLLGASNVAEEAAVDRYDFLKNAYFQRRNFLVNDGKVNDDSDIDNIDTPSSESTPAKPQ